MDLRQHRKIVLIDNYISYTGSMNMVDPRYFKQDAGVGQWIDIMVRMEGPVSTTLVLFMLSTGKWKPVNATYHRRQISILCHLNKQMGILPQVIASGPGFS